MPRVCRLVLPYTDMRIWYTHTPLSTTAWECALEPIVARLHNNAVDLADNNTRKKVYLEKSALYNERAHRRPSYLHAMNFITSLSVFFLVSVTFDKKDWSWTEREKFQIHSNRKKVNGPWLSIFWYRDANQNGLGIFLVPNRFIGVKLAKTMSCCCCFFSILVVNCANCEHGKKTRMAGKRSLLPKKRGKRVRIGPKKVSRRLRHEKSAMRTIHWTS